jgi:hypothetical protein
MAAFSLLASLCPPTMHIGQSERQTAEAPVFPGRGFSASVARLSRERASGALRCAITTIPRPTPVDQEGGNGALDRDAERVLNVVRLAGDQIHGFLTMGKIIAGSSLRRSRNVDLSRTGLVRLPVYCGMDCSFIPDITAIHTGRAEGQRQSTRTVDRDDPARAANCG